MVVVVLTSLEPPLNQEQEEAFSAAEVAVAPHLITDLTLALVALVALVA